LGEQALPVRKPLAGDVGAHVGLVLVIGADDFDLHALGGRVEVLDRLARGPERTRTGDVGIQTRHVIEHADLDDTVGVLGMRNRGGAHQGECRRDLSECV